MELHMAKTWEQPLGAESGPSQQQNGDLSHKTQKNEFCTQPMEAQERPFPVKPPDGPGVSWYPIINPLRLSIKNPAEAIFLTHWETVIFFKPLHLC